MAWGGKNDDDSGPKPWRETMAWLGCLFAAVMPTLVLTTLARTGDHAVSPVFTPALLIGVFTVMVLIVRPWTLR